MRTTVWAFLLAAITFGIGWTSSQLMTDPAPAAGPSETTTGRWPGRGPGGPGGPGGFGGPGMGSADQFADALALDPAQRERLATLLDDSARRIREHEESIFSIKADTRRGMIDLLTDAQREELDRLFAERMAKRSVAHVKESIDWFRRNTELGDQPLASVEAALTEYESAKGLVLSRMFCERDAEPIDRDDAIDRLRQERDARLEAVLGAELLGKYREERYREDRSSRRFGGRSGHDKSGPPDRGGSEKE